MIFMFMALCAAHFVMSGLWLAEIINDRRLGQKTQWQVYTWTGSCFLFGVYFMIALIGRTGA